jgi:FkbM family methyltransferase
MTFISYAQNAEDVVLWRALKDVENGFYIDVGACDPTELSVTRAFYERGWSGINIEPSREYHERCVAERPRDLNLNVAAGARSGILRFHNVAGTGLSTTVAAIADSAARQGFTVEERDVPVLTLADICADAARPEIHFLKIDVEGGEMAVLEGADFNRFRPWIVVIEATVPLSSERNDAAWQPLMRAASYEQAFFDGLNLYFVAAEKRGLIAALATPANVLDDYKPVALHLAEKQVATLAENVAQQEVALRQANQQVTEQAARLAEQEHALAAQALKLKETGRNLAEQQRQLRENAVRLREQAETLEQVAQAVAMDAQADGMRVMPRGNVAMQVRQQLAERGRELTFLRLQHGDLMRHRDSLLASTSWRLTAPLRKTRTAISVIRSQPSQFVPLLMGNLRGGNRAGAMLGLASATDRQPSQPLTLPENYASLGHRDRLVAFIRTDMERQRQAAGHSRPHPT